MKYITALIAVAQAGTMTFDDLCTNDMDCGNFFNEPMRCADVFESWTAQNPFSFGTSGSKSYRMCVINAMCGWVNDEVNWYTGTYTCGGATATADWAPAANNAYAWDEEGDWDEDNEWNYDAQTLQVMSMFRAKAYNEIDRLSRSDRGSSSINSLNRRRSRRSSRGSSGGSSGGSSSRGSSRGTASSTSTTSATTATTETAEATTETAEATTTDSDIGADAAEFDIQLWQYQNQVRANPQSMIPDLEEMLTWFEGDTIYEPGTDYGLMTSEGPAAVQELIDFLMEQEPVNELEWQHNLMYASRDHVLDTGPSGLTGHYGTDGSSPSDRMERYVTLEGMSGENIAYGEQSPERTIMSLAIDDGVASRGHRANIFESGYFKFACFTGDHSVYGQQTVLNYNGSDDQMNDFMAQEVEFGPMPDDTIGYSESTSITMGDGLLTRTTTRTYFFEDGSTQDETIVATEPM